MDVNVRITLYIKMKVHKSTSLPLSFEGSLAFGGGEGRGDHSES